MADAVRWTEQYQQPVQWQLELDGEVVARIDADEYDFPFTYGWLVDSPRFERFRRYFSDDTDWPEELETLCGEEQDRGGFVLRELPTGIAYSCVCLNHDGKQCVWFRYGDPTPDTRQ